MAGLPVPLTAAQSVHTSPFLQNLSWSADGRIACSSHRCSICPHLPISPKSVVECRWQDCLFLSPLLNLSTPPHFFKICRGVPMAGLPVPLTAAQSVHTSPFLQNLSWSADGRI